MTDDAKYDDLNTSLITVVGFLAAIVTFALIIGLQVLYYHFDSAEVYRKQIAGAAPPQEVLVAQQKAKLTTFGWIDREKKQIAIPIDLAMDLVVREANQGRLAVNPPASSPPVN